MPWPPDARPQQEGRHAVDVSRLTAIRHFRGPPPRLLRLLRWRGAQRRPALVRRRVARRRLVHLLPQVRSALSALGPGPCVPLILSAFAEEPAILWKPALVFVCYDPKWIVDRYSGDHGCRRPNSGTACIRIVTRIPFRKSITLLP